MARTPTSTGGDPSSETRPRRRQRDEVPCCCIPCDWAPRRREAVPTNALLLSPARDSEPSGRSRPGAAVTSSAAQVPVWSVKFTLCGVHLLGNGLFVIVVSEPLELLAFELGEADAVGGVADVEVEHGPDERQAAGLAGEAADHLGAALDLTERAFEQVR